MKPSIAWLFTDWQANPFRQENDLYGGIGYYRAVLPARYLRKWFDIEIIGQDLRHWGTIDETFTRLGRDYDLIISKHIHNAQTISNILATAQHYKKKVLIDMDDNYLQVRDDTVAAKDYSIGRQGRYYVGASLELADGVTVSTEPLKEVYSKFNKNIHVLPNCNDYKEWPKLAKKKDEIIRIGFAGGSEHNRDLEMVAEPIAKILEDYPNVQFDVIGALGPATARGLAGKMLKFAGHKILDRFRIGGGTMAWQGYPELLSAQSWDIGICPLEDDEFNKGKSHIKWMDYTMAGMAVIASPVYPYTMPIDGVEIIKHGETGLFATDSDSWYDQLKFLIEHPAYRTQLNRNARKHIKEHWQQKQWAEKWRDVINQYL